MRQSLSFRDAKLCFLDIFEAIEMIERFTAGMNFEDFRTDPKTVAAVERKLQVISEAAIRIGPNATSDYPWLPWHDIRGIGNWLRHQYERVELPVIWGTGDRRFAASESCCAACLGGVAYRWTGSQCDRLSEPSSHS